MMGAACNCSLCLSSFFFFLLLHIAWRERQRDRERLEDGVVGASMTNFPFFYGSINLTGGGLWG